MKLILFLGFSVLLEIVSGKAHNEQIKSRQKRGHETHQKKEHHLTEKGLNKPDIAPSANVHQNRFNRFLEKYEKFSKPNNRWQKAPVDRKNYHVNAANSFNKKDKLLEHKKHKMDSRKHNQHEMKKLIKETQSRKDAQLMFGKKDEQRSEMQKQREQRKNHLTLFGKDALYKKWMTQRNNRRNWRHQQIRKDLDKHRERIGGRNEKDDKMEKDNHSKFERRHHYLQRKTHFGRHAEGHKPFGRHNKKQAGPESNFCKMRRSVKCPDYKREICGSDGKTYQNKCFLIEEMCKKDSKIDMKLTKRGACDERKILH